MDVYRLATKEFQICDKLSSSMDMDYFVDWLVAEMGMRGWSQSDLARKARINRQVISNYINRQRNKPDEEILRSIARAFGYPPEEVFRVAGLLPPITDRRKAVEEILSYKTSELTDHQLDELIAYIDFLQQRDLRNSDRRLTNFQLEDDREGAAPPDVIKSK